MDTKRLRAMIRNAKFQLEELSHQLNTLENEILLINQKQIKGENNDMDN